MLTKNSGNSGNRNVCAVCIISRNVDHHWVEFLKSFVSYDVYIMVDDNTEQLSADLNGVQILQVADDVCKEAGYTNINFYLGKRITSWEKALYHFTHHANASYEHIWFLEDDVFVHSEQALKRIDEEYPSSDLLSSSVNENTHGDRSIWHWPSIVCRVPPPWYYGMMCGVRMSTALLDCIRLYVAEHREMFFLEAMFPTLCRTNGLSHAVVPALETIVYWPPWSVENMDTFHLFHPMKNTSSHVWLRESLSKE